MSIRQRYPSDLTDLQWDNIEHLFPPEQQPPGRPGRRRAYPRRGIVNAVFYLSRSGCAWRMPPHDFPPRKTVSYYFHAWRDRGLREEVHDVLRVGVRRPLAREDTPGAGIIDSQTVRTTEAGGPKGYDAGKKNRRPRAARAG